MLPYIFNQLTGQVKVLASTFERNTYRPVRLLIYYSPDLFVIGFQEIVPLTAQQIVQTDPEKRCVPISIQTRDAQYFG